MSISLAGDRFSQVIVSAVQQWTDEIGVGVVFRTRRGVSVRKLGYVVANVTIEHAIYEAVLEALRDTAEAGMRGVTVYIDGKQIADQLRLRAEPPDDVHALFLQVRCQANALWPTRFELAKPSLGFAARRLATDALEHGGPVIISHGTPALQFAFSGDLVA